MAYIPESSSQALTLVSFQEALAKYERETCQFDKSKWIYIPHVDLEYRYVLGTKGDNPLICLGINPSTAIPGNLDNTMKSVERIALGNGYDSFIMFNVYAQRATLPSNMDIDLNPQLHQENMDAFRYCLTQGSHGNPKLWAAWGTIIEHRPWLINLVKEMIALGNTYGATWYSAGPLSKKGHPRHPLYLSKSTKLEMFDVNSYVNT